jgi:glutamine amidotransferase
VCELFCLSSRLPTTTTFSLEKFARRGGLGGAIDGWGVAFHDGRDVRLYKEPEPAEKSEWLTFVNQRRLSSRYVLSHIRRATRGDLSLANTQPFARELGGRMHVFAHNGRFDDIESRHANEWQRFQPVGETDSEVAFCVLLERLVPLWSNGTVPSVDARIAILSDFAADMRKLGPANFVYTDGDALFVHGHRRIQRDGAVAPPGLWYLSRHCTGNSEELSSAGVVIEPAERMQDVLLFASVPLTGEHWRPLMEGEVVAVGNGDVLRSLASFSELDQTNAY